MESIINSRVPEFKVNAFQNGEFKTVSSDDIKGKWALFFFYPADFTFVCPTELVDLAEKYDELKAMGVEVFSVSCDTHFVHKAWHDASDSIKKIKYTMLADPLGTLAKGFGVYIEEEGMAYRGTFLVNPEGQVKVAEIQDNSIGRRTRSQGSGCTVCGFSRRRGLSGKMEAGRRYPQTKHRPRWQTLIAREEKEIKTGLRSRFYRLWKILCRTH